MDNDPIPDINHVARYCSFRTLDENGNPTLLAFELKDADTYLSVNWLEFFEAGSCGAQIEEVRQAFERKGHSLQKKARFAVLNVRDVCAYVHENTSDKRKLEILHKPEPLDPSHSGVFGLQHDSDMIVEALLANMVLETHPARQEMDQ